MSAHDFWTKIHTEKYATIDWINKPTIFATQIVGYLPVSGSILELGAGQGQDSRFFAKQGFQVLSTDFNEPALEISKAKAATEHLEITYQVVDLHRSLPFENETFDVVYSHLALHYFGKEKTRQIFEDIHRVLKPNGTFAFLVNTIEDPETTDPDFEQLEPYLYREKKTGLIKAFFSADYARELTQGLFDLILLDVKGETHKDHIKTLIRFVGRKIAQNKISAVRR